MTRELTLIKRTMTVVQGQVLAHLSAGSRILNGRFA